jgi:hypothetical protein
MSTLLKLYPSTWRARYGDEMEALLDSRRPDRRARLDLVRGALDAWVHPATPSMVPIFAALIGGGLWTVVATAVLVQPAPLDWPGYLAEVLPLAAVAACCLLVAVLGCSLRAGEGRSRAGGLVTALVLVGYLAWIGLLGASILDVVGSPPLAAAQALAMIGTIGVGLILVRSGDEPIGLVLVGAPVAMLAPWAATWLVFGAAWTAVGLAMWLDRASRTGPTQLAT